jgi:hypothetical protein
MSPSIRLSHLLLLSISLLLAWLGVHQLRDMSSGGISGLLLVGMAMLIFAWAVTKARRLLLAVDTDSTQSTSTWRLGRLIRAVRDRLGLHSSILFGGCAILVAPYPSFQPWPVLALWVAGIVLLLVGAAQLESRNVIGSIIASVSTWIRTAHWELLWVLALTLLGLLLRSIALDAIPHNVHGDEGEMGMVARAVLRGELRDPFATAWLGHPTLWFFLQALALDLFGDRIGGLRMLSALLGTLAVPALYIFARPLYGRAVAIIATALLAGYHLHIHYSRIGLNNIADPLMMTLTLAAFFYGYRTRAPVGFALAGVIMGLAQYFYFSARFIPVLMLLLLAYLVVRDRQQLLKLWRQIGLLAIGFILAIGPLLRYFITRPDIFVARLAEQGLLQDDHLAELQANGQSLFAALVEHAYRSFGLLVFVEENSPFYGSGIPLLDQGSTVLFILSVVLMLLHWRQLESIVLLLWVGVTAFFGGFIIFGSPMSTRYVIAAPALCILIALALVQIGSLLRQTMALSPQLYIGAVSVTVLLIMGWNIYFYFGIYTPRNSYAQAQAVTEIANYLRPQAGQRYVYMFATPYFYLHHGTIAFVGKQPDGTDVIDHLSSSTTLGDPPPGLRPLFIFVSERLSELEIVKQRYPGGELREYRIQPGDDRTLMYIYEPHA